jgi:hypothetical protein
VITRRKLLKGACLSVAAPSFGSLSFGPASAADGTIRIGVLTDLSGLYSDSSGAGSVVRRGNRAWYFITANAFFGTDF